MNWKKIPYHKVPRWVKRRKRTYVKGRTYLYMRKGKKWYRRLKGEWDNIDFGCRFDFWDCFVLDIWIELTCATVDKIVQDS